MKTHLKCIGLLVWLVFLDLATKWVFYTHHFANTWIIIKPIFNTGVSRSLQVPMIVTILIGWISLMLFYVMYHQKYITRYFAALLMAGTIGNLVDRMIFGWVRDFIFVGSWFPIFNIADICLNVGIFWFFIKELRSPRGESQLFRIWSWKGPTKS